MKGKYSWVTCVEDAGEAVKAILLVRSLRRVLTRRQTVVFVKETIPSNLKAILAKEFDFHYGYSLLEHGHSSGGDFISDCLNFCLQRGFRKLAFIQSDSLFLKNADSLFELENDGVIHSKSGSLIFSLTSTLKAMIVSESYLNDKPSNKQREEIAENEKNEKLKKQIGLAEYETIEFERNIQETRIVTLVDVHSSILEEGFRCEASKTFVGAQVERLYASLLSEDLLCFFSRKAQLDFPKELESGSPTVPAELADSVAIIGMSFRLPGANNEEEFWSLLQEGREGITRVPDWRWQNPVFGSEERDFEGGFLSVDVEEFDAKFFGMSPKEVSLMDPQQRLVLQLVWEALEQAGVDGGRLWGTLAGVFGGWWRNDFKEILQETEGVLQLSQMTEYFRLYMGNTIGNLTGRISHLLGLTGPTVSTESGCSTSMVAVDMAVESLLNDKCDFAIALGVNLLLHPLKKEPPPQAMLAFNGRCKTFDAKADGFGRAEGVTVLLLKRLGDALRDNDNVLGLIRSTAVVQEGLSKSIGTPTVACEALAMKLALRRAGVDPGDVEFVETHGTGTPVGDPLEVAAIAEAYGKGRKTPLTIGSVKTNIGHTESCSGIAGIIKTLLVFKHQTIPRHLNFHSLNPDVNLDAIPATIPLSNVDWKRRVDGPPRIAGVSSFGITGTDAHAILQESPFVDEEIRRSMFFREPSMFLLKLSAQTEEALAEMKANYANFLGENATESLVDLTYTANVGRADMAFRTFGVGRTNEELLGSLGKMSIKKKVSTRPKVCFLFTGQGSQWVGMGRALYDQQPLFRVLFDRCADILEKSHGIRIKEAMWGDDTESLKRTIYSQTSIFAVEVSLLRLWESWGVKPDVVLGHSLGEFAAAVAANILSIEDALALVATRSKLVEALPEGKMLVVKADRNTVEELVKKLTDGKKIDLDIAAVNSNEQTVLAGSIEDITAFQEVCVNNQMKSTLLASTHAFHSSHMDPMLDKYEAVARKIDERMATIPFVSGMEGVVMEGRLGAKYWRDHTRKGVEFLAASRALLRDVGAHVCLEVGPQPVLSSLLMENADDLTSTPVSCFPSLRRNEDAMSTMAVSLGKLWVAGVDVDWESFHQFSLGRKVTLPFYPFQRKKFPLEVDVDKPKSTHPLVGFAILNPSDTKMFRNILSLDQTPWLRDHVIGGTFLFPGAGLVEMLLVAGYAGTGCLEGSFQLPLSPLALHDFQIEAPFALHEGAKTQVQVTVADVNGESRVSLFSRLPLDDRTAKWVRHATANFFPLDTLDKPTRNAISAHSLADLQTRCTTKMETDKTYGELAKHGFKFGCTFQTLKAAWNNPEESDEFLCELNVTCQSDAHVMHPVMIDAMFQALMLTLWKEGDGAEEKRREVFVPISISKFVWFKKISTVTAFIHNWTSKEAGNGESVAVLYDANGELIAVMVGATLLETTLSSISLNLESQKSSFPRMYQDVWRTQLGPREKRMPNESLELVETLNVPESLRKLEKYNFPGGEIEVEYRKANFLYLQFFLKAFVGLGWESAVGEEVQLDKLVARLSILPQFTKFTRYLLFQLTEDGYLTKTDDDLFKVTKPLPPLSTLNSTINLLLEDPVVRNCQEIKDVSSIGNRLGEILKGKISSLPLLFPDNVSEEKMGLAENFYKATKMSLCTRSAWVDIQERLFLPINTHLETNKGKSVFRVLEVGAGTGSATEVLLKAFTLDPSNYEYTFTDISPIFFKHGEAIFKESGIKVIYKTLNIEEDVYSQGFTPHQYDLVVASFVIHATPDIRQTLANIQRLAAAGATIIIMELCRPMRAVNILFGTLEGFSRFNDYDLRKHHPELAQEKWVEILSDLGFQKTKHFPAYFDHSAIIFTQNSCRPEQMKIHKQPSSPTKSWVVFCRDKADEEFFSRKLRKLNRSVHIVDGSTSRTQEVVYAKVKSLTEEKTIVTEGILFLWGLQENATLFDFPPVVESFLGLCRAVSSYAPATGLHALKVIVATSGLHSVHDDATRPPFFSVLFGMSKSLQNENLNLSCRCVDVFGGQVDGNQLDTVVDEMFIDDSEFTVSYRGARRNVKRLIPVKASVSKSLSIPKSERFRLSLPSTNAISDLRFSPANPPQLGDHDVEVRVKTYSMNFRDVLAILKPTRFFEDMTAVGNDIAGIVTAVGPKVTKRKVGDKVIGFNEHNDSLPSHVRCNEDLLLPLPSVMTFAEAVTLPAVVATVYVCLVKVAQLKKEDTVLIHTGSGGVGLCAIQLAQSIGCRIVTTAGSPRKRTYLKNLGIEHVYNSRTTDYGAEILRDVGGVDVVLNSLTSEGFKEATLACCKPGARFVEMSKLNVWTKEEANAIRPDVDYSLVDISNPTQEETLGFIQQVDNFRQKSSVKPLPYTRFEAADIRDALTYMQKAKHIGKIILAMPEPNSGGGWKVGLFNEKSTYLITGGLGGIGMEIAKWMVSHGASHVLLASRNPPTPKTQTQIDDLNSKGANVEFRQCDVGHFDECRRLLDSIKSDGHPPLRGIMHAAGVISDASYENQTWSKFQETFYPKVNGGWNLHSLTLNDPLEHFVMFSSAAASLGTVGQANHSAANTFLDHLAFHRHSIGLAASTVNWGQWGQVGVAANIEVIGLKPFSTLQATSALEFSMRSQLLQVCVCETDFYFIRKTFGSFKKYLCEMNFTDSHVSNFKIDGDVFWKEYDSAEDKTEKQSVVTKYLSLLIREVLKMEDSDPLDADAIFQDMGMDSLMMIEMKNLIQTVIGDRVKISISQVKDCSTVNQLSLRLFELISGEYEPKVAPLTREELVDLVEKDSTLPDSISIRLNDQKATFLPSAIRSVLITGVTGNFGPHVLRTICERSHIQKVYCLMKPSPTVEPRTRLEKILKQKYLFEKTNMEKVECIEGDVGEDNLGMKSQNYEELANSVDAVINLAIKADILGGYNQNCKSRTVNVIGTVNVLKFACHLKMKQVLHASTVYVSVELNEYGFLSEEWPKKETFQYFVDSAYPVSKFVSDLLVTEAARRGIPCKIFRFPFLGGDSSGSGGTNLMGNNLVLRMMAYMSIGAMPAAAIPFSILPVDQAAELASQLFFNDGTEFEVYNVVSPFANDEQELENIAPEFGFTVKVIDRDEFIQKVESMENSELMNIAKQTVRSEGRTRGKENMAPVLQAWAKNKNIFCSKKLERWIPNYTQCFEPSISLLRRDLEMARRTGLFEKAGLKPK